MAASSYLLTADMLDKSDAEVEIVMQERVRVNNTRSF